jgi:hypothetical protein
MGVSGLSRMPVWTSVYLCSYTELRTCGWPSWLVRPACLAARRHLSLTWGSLQVRVWYYLVLACMFEIWFCASTKMHWLPVYYFFILYWQMQIFDWLAGTKCLASMFEIGFRASTKTHWLPVSYFFILYLQMQIFDELAGTKCLAGMFEIWFRASTKMHWLPVYYFFILPVQNVLPVCLKLGSVPVQKHTGCRYIIVSFCTGKCKFLISMLVQNVMPVCLRFGSVPVQKS